jgi:hypothetical protein
VRLAHRRPHEEGLPLLRPPQIFGHALLRAPRRNCLQSLGAKEESGLIVHLFLGLPAGAVTPYGACGRKLMKLENLLDWCARFLIALRTIMDRALDGKNGEWRSQDSDEA